MRHWPVPLVLLGLLATPAGAETLGWQGSITRLAEQAAHPPAGVRLRSLAIKDLVEERSQVRWPLSDQLETGLVAALQRAHPAFALLNDGATSSLGAGADGVLSGVFARDAASHRTRVSLWVRDARTQETLYALAPLDLEDTILPTGALPAIGVGRLVVSCDLGAAQIFVDGLPSGRGAIAQSLSVGSHVVTVAAEGYDVFESPVEIRSGEALSLHPALRRPPVTVRVVGTPAGAHLVVDGEERGRLPAALELAAGKHHLVAQLPGYRSLERDLEWDPTKPATVSIALEPVPGSLLVSSEVTGATLTLDGQAAGRTPRLFSELTPGRHVLHVEAPGFLPFDASVTVESEKMANQRIRLLRPGQSLEPPATAVALVPRSGAREDLLLAERLAAHLAKNHPSLQLVPPIAAAQAIDRLFPEGLREDPDAIHTLASNLKARQVVLVGVSKFSPFSRTLGLWPNRPELSIESGRFRASGTPEERLIYSETGGEPWGLGGEAPGLSELSAALIPAISDAIAGEESIASAATGAPLANEAYLLAGISRLNLGLGYERRLLPFLDLGVSASYYNAFDADRTDGTKLSGNTGSSDLIYGVAQAYQTRLDALLRFDGPPALHGPYFEGARWAPYLGVGYRLNLNRYEVFGVGRKSTEGGFWQPQQRGVAVAGLKMNVGGSLWRAEVEAPVIYSVWDTPDIRVTLGTGALW